MLDLVIALVWTPLGIGALAAAAAAVLAVVYLPRLALPLAAKVQDLPRTDAEIADAEGDASSAL